MVCCGTRIISGCCFSKPYSKGKNYDVNRFTQRISRGDKGKTEFPSLSLKASANKSRITWEMLDISKCIRNYIGKLVKTVLEVKFREQDSGWDIVVLPSGYYRIIVVPLPQP